MRFSGGTPTFLRQTFPFVRLKFICVSFVEYSSVTSSLCIVQHHGLVEEVEALHLLYSTPRSVWVVEDDECLSFSFEIRLGNQVDNTAISGEDIGQGLLELINLYALLKIFDLAGGLAVGRSAT